MPASPGESQAGDGWVTKHSKRTVQHLCDLEEMRQYFIGQYIQKQFYGTTQDRLLPGVDRDEHQRGHRSLMDLEQTSQRAMFQSELVSNQTKLA